MKKLKALLVSAAVVLGLGALSTTANAQTIGYVNYKTVESNYEYAKSAYKEIDTKYLELQQYLMDKEKQYKNIDSPINKRTLRIRFKRILNLKMMNLINSN